MTYSYAANIEFNAAVQMMAAAAACAAACAAG